MSLNERATTDARHARSGSDGMLYNEDGEPFAQVDSYQTKGNFSNSKYNPIGQNRELEVNGTIGVTLVISEIVVLDGYLFNKVIEAVANGESLREEMVLRNGLHIETVFFLVTMTCRMCQQEMC